MATTPPRDLSAATMAFLWRGVTRANTVQRPTAPPSCPAESLSSCSPVSTCSSRSAMPACRATASAVLAWSPVIITGVMPARTHSATASVTPCLSPSLMPHSPRYISPSSLSPPSAKANASTRSARPLISSFSAAMRSLSARVSGRTPPPSSMYAHRPSSLSGAPLEKL